MSEGSEEQSAPRYRETWAQAHAREHVERSGKSPTSRGNGWLDRQYNVRAGRAIDQREDARWLIAIPLPAAPVPCAHGPFIAGMNFAHLTTVFFGHCCKWQNHTLSDDAGTMLVYSCPAMLFDG